jgi:hypothetical protein
VVYIPTIVSAAQIFFSFFFSSSPPFSYFVSIAYETRDTIVRALSNRSRYPTPVAVRGVQKPSWTSSHMRLWC